MDSKELLRERLRNMSVSGRSCYLIYGNDEPETKLIRAADKFTVKVKSEDLPEGEKRVLVGSARNVAVAPLLENEYVVLDKAALEVIEDFYQQ
jgi:hypothetical protein